MYRRCTESLGMPQGIMGEQQRGREGLAVTKEKVQVALRRRQGRSYAGRAK